jgi:hypothetical protein
MIHPIHVDNYPLFASYPHKNHFSHSSRKTGVRSSGRVEVEWKGSFAFLAGVWYDVRVLGITKESIVIALFKVPREFALKDAEKQIELCPKENPEEAEKMVEGCRQLIRKYLTLKTKNVYRGRGSYGLKHDFERVLGFYVCNGAAIKAMLLEGFEPQCQNGTIGGSTKEMPLHNYNFNLSKKQLKEMIGSKS